MSGALCFLGLKAVLPAAWHLATHQQMELGHSAGEGGLWFLLLQAQQQYHLSPSKNHKSTWFKEPSRHTHTPQKSKEVQC